MARQDVQDSVGWNGIEQHKTEQDRIEQHKTEQD